LSLQISIPNPGGAFAFKPSIFFEAAPADTFATAGAGTSVSIDDPVLGGTFGYSVGTPVDWQTDIGQSFQANLEQVGPTALDTTPPTIAFVGNNGAYGLLDTVDITCAATDPAPGSGVAVDPCLSFGIDAPAWTFGPGTTTLPQPGLVATDGAGNSSAPATTSFTVTATPHDLCTLTTRFVQGSSRYARLGPLQRRLVDVLAGDACSAINAIAPRLQPARKAAFVRAYTQVVAGLASAGWLTSAQASTLSALAHTL
ncbi:MAG: hypothetical protein ACRDM1_00790, partial [Gaiellaceae bacterium]